MEHDLLDEIKVAFAHDELLEIIDWTRKETTQEPRPCADLGDWGLSPRLRLFKCDVGTQGSQQSVELLGVKTCINNLLGQIADQLG